MNPKSQFQQIAQLITVADVCKKFLNLKVDISDPVDMVFADFSVICMEESLDMMLELALVTDDHNIVGYLYFEELETDKTISECMNTIQPDQYISANTSLIDFIAILAFQRHTKPYMVINGADLIGWVNFRSLNSLPFRLCLFAMLNNLEWLMLRILGRSPKKFFMSLHEDRQEVHKKGYRFDALAERERSYAYSAMMNRTNVLDKLNMLSKNYEVCVNAPSLNIRDQFTNTLNLRNRIAHPETEESYINLFQDVHELNRYVKWGENLESELNGLLDNPDLFDKWLLEEDRR